MTILRKISQTLHGPRCHVTADEKAWVEQRMLWLHKQFGNAPLRRVPLAPGNEALPKRWDNSERAGVDLFDRLCKFMLVDRDRLHLHFYSKSDTHEIESDHAGHSSSSGPAGLYMERDNWQKLVIALEKSALKDPRSLAATICHELGHVHLLGDKRIERTEADCEPLTDLLTVYFGAGVMTANCAFQFSQWMDGKMQGWNAKRQGYLSECMFGYSLACFCWLQGDLTAPWRKHLRENIAYYFEDALHFLCKTRDTTLPFGTP